MRQPLFTTRHWESVKPADVVYDHFFYSESEPGKVMVVHGFVKTSKRVQLSNGRMARKSCYRKAVWNASGHCRIGSFHMRDHKHDIPLGLP